MMTFKTKLQNHPFKEFTLPIGKRAMEVKALFETELQLIKDELLSICETEEQTYKALNQFAKIRDKLTTFYKMYYELTSNFYEECSAEPNFHTRIERKKRLKAQRAMQRLERLMPELIERAKLAIRADLPFYRKRKGLDLSREKFGNYLER